MIVFPIIAILGFLDVIPVSKGLAWFALAIFVVCLLVFWFSFKGKEPERG